MCRYIKQLPIRIHFIFERYCLQKYFKGWLNQLIQLHLSKLSRNTSPKPSLSLRSSVKNQDSSQESINTRSENLLIREFMSSQSNISQIKLLKIILRLNTLTQLFHSWNHILESHYIISLLKRNYYDLSINHILNFMYIIFVLMTLHFASQVNGQLPNGFDYLYNIDPSIILQPRYAIPNNFVGETIDGYLRKTVIITKNAGFALANVQSDLKKLGYSLVVYDAYRPQKGVDHFVRWSEQPEDFKTKAQFYPYLDKQRIIPEGYVAKKSGHSRGSTVDLTIIPLGQSIHQVQLYQYTLTDGSTILYRDDGSEFMGGHFDYFGQLSHHNTTLIQNPQLQKRNLLKFYMQKNGFRPLKQQWWHYTLILQPFPDTYFDFDIV